MPFGTAGDVLEGDVCNKHIGLGLLFGIGTSTEIEKQLFRG